MKVIFNADDFGRSSEINRAVVQAHREGVLTSASLMVTGVAAAEAVEMARAMPTLAVGLHLVLSDGRPASPPREIPHLVRGAERFPNSAALVWIQYIFSRAARAEMARELRAQFECFAAAALPLDHVDSHQHIHMHPAVFSALLPLARQYGAGGVRLPRDDFWLAMRVDRSYAVMKAIWGIVFGLLCRRYLLLLEASPNKGGQPMLAHRLVVADRVFGLMQSGAMEEAYVVRLLSTLQSPPGRGRSRPQIVELYFHPAAGPGHVPLGPNPGDLATLLSPAVRAVIKGRGLELTSYATLEGLG